MAAKKFLDKQFTENKGRAPGGQWDPYFEYRPNKRGKMKKVKKQVPDYIPAHDAKVLAEVRKWAYRMDVKLNFMGMRFGWAAIIGAIPEIGDVLDILLAYYIYSKCKKVEGGLDRKTKGKMKMWIVTNGLIGLIPFVGDLVDASIKPNARNCRLLEEYLDRKYKPRPLADEEDRHTAERMRADPNYRPPAPATVYEDYSDEEDHHHHDPRYDDRRGNGRHRDDTRGAGRSTAYSEKRSGDRRRR